MESIGSFDAKTRLSELLERAAKGEVFEITKHGRPLARLVPCEVIDPASIARAVERLKHFHEGKPAVTREELLDSIHEGHRV